MVPAQAFPADASALQLLSGRVPLLLTKSDVDKGVDETNYQDWLAEQGETA